MPALLDHKYKTLQGGEVNLCDYADRPILVVNTASKCGYTPQFEKLEGMFNTKVQPDSPEIMSKLTPVLK